MAIIRGLILDYGEVLCHRPTPEQWQRLYRAAGLDEATFVTRYFQERLPYDRGDLQPSEYWSKVAGPAVLDDGMLDTLSQWDVEMWSALNPNMTDWLLELRGAGLKTGLLSNMPFDMARHARRSFDWLRQLDSVVLSCELRLIKPDRAIYERSLEALGLQPSEACFIDDRDVNVEGARAVGIHALHFHTIDRLREDLAALGIPVLPRA